MGKPKVCSFGPDCEGRFSPVLGRPRFSLVRWTKQASLRLAPVSASVFGASCMNAVWLKGDAFRARFFLARCA
jgi:hypothetical protein